MGTDQAGIFAFVENSLDMEEVNIITLWDSTAVQFAFNDNLLHCKIMPASNQEWVVASDEPLMFSKVDHVLDTADSYYLPVSADYELVQYKDGLHIDSGGSVYFLVDDRSSQFHSYVIKIASIGDLTVTIATISGSGLRYDPWGLTSKDSNLIVGVEAYFNSDYKLGIIEMDTTSLNQVGHFTTAAGLLADYHSQTLKHITGSKFFTNYDRDV